MDNTALEKLRSLSAGGVKNGREEVVRVISYHSKRITAQFKNLIQTLTQITPKRVWLKEGWRSTSHSRENHSTFTGFAIQRAHNVDVDIAAVFSCEMFAVGDGEDIVEGMFWPNNSVLNIVC